MKVSTIWKNKIRPRAWYYEKRRFLTVLGGFALGMYLITFLLCEQTRMDILRNGPDQARCVDKYVSLLIESARKIVRNFYAIQVVEMRTSANRLITNGSGLRRADTLQNTRKKKHRLNVGAFEEYGDACNAIERVWQSYPFKEVQGYITRSGKLIVTGVGTLWKVSGPRPILYQGNYYFPWDKRRPLLSFYDGTIDYSSSQHVFIPVRAMFHTHVVSSELSYRDLENACTMPEMTHLLIERERTTVFDCDGVTGEFTINGGMGGATCAVLGE